MTFQEFRGNKDPRRRADLQHPQEPARCHQLRPHQRGGDGRGVRRPHVPDPAEDGPGGFVRRSRQQGKVPAKNEEHRDAGHDPGNIRRSEVIPPNSLLFIFF